MVQPDFFVLLLGKCERKEIKLGLPSGKHSLHFMTSKDGPEAGAQSHRGLFPGFET